MEMVLVGIVALLLGAGVGTFLIGIRERKAAAAREAGAVEMAVAQLRGEQGVLQERLRQSELALVDATRNRVALQAAETKNAALQSSVAETRERLTERGDDLRQAQEKLATAEQLRTSAEVALAESRTQHQAQVEGWKDKLALLANAREDLGKQFELLANRVLEAKVSALGTQGKEGLGAVLEPFKTQLSGFQNKLESFQTQHTADNSTLQNELKHLGETTRGMTEEADRLSKALTTNPQVRGAWGEQVLQRLLEIAGLREGPDYTVQDSHTLDDGKRSRPDVVVNLPQTRKVVIDSKVSLVDFVAYTAATDVVVRESALQRHVAAVRARVKELSDKHYQDLYGVETLDFVILFVPIEPAYLAALDADDKLYNEAWKRHVMFACPSTLLSVLRIVAYLWTQELQARNVEEIVKRGSDLYDKFVGFVEDLTKVGESLSKADKSYQSAMGKLSVGKGNLVRQVEMLAELGVKPKKQLPPELLEIAKPENDPAALHAVTGTQVSVVDPSLA